MFLLIPWDVWLAGAIFVATALWAIFEPPAVAFLVIYLMLAAYIAVKTFDTD